jgi:hypothetical protein
VEKLRAFFAQHGVQSTSAIISGTISSNSIQTTPIALAKSVTAVALVNGSAASTSTLTLVKGALKLMAWTKAKMAIVIGLGIIIATGTTTVVVAEMYSQKPVHLAAGALPETLAELNVWYVEPSAGQNAATFILQGVDAMQIAGASQNANLPILGNLPLPRPSAPLPSAVKSALTDFLQHNQDALQFFGQAAQYEQSRYPVDFTKNAGLPYLQGVNNGGKLCEMAAILDAENGDGKRAGDEVVMALTLARSLKAEPVIISQLVRVAGILFAETALNQSVNRTTLPPESLSALAQMFRDMEQYDASGEGFYRALVGEKVMDVALLNNRKQLLREEAKIPRLVDYVNNNANLRAEQDFAKSTFQQLMTASQDVFPNRLKSFNDVLQERASEARDQGLLLSANYLGGFGNLVERQARGVAALRLAMTAIALEQYRTSHNRYPDNLSGLVPAYLDAPLTDPFDGHPLRYRKQAAGYVLYSIGPDLKDDGGNPGKDLVFAVTTPPAY